MCLRTGPSSLVRRAPRITFGSSSRVEGARHGGLRTGGKDPQADRHGRRVLVFPQEQQEVVAAADRRDRAGLRRARAVVGHGRGAVHLHPLLNRMMSDPAIRIPARRKFLYASVLAVLALLACEGALRVRAKIKYGAAATGVRDPMVQYDREAELNVPRPGYEVSGGRINIKIDSLGFRGDEITREKP